MRRVAPWRVGRRRAALGERRPRRSARRERRHGARGRARRHDKHGAARPGDLIRPWMAERGSDLLGQQVHWHVMADARLALLDRAFGMAVRDFPEVNAMLLDRLNGRLERLATMKAIAQLNMVDRRLMALFWHLAERWGRVTPEGIVVPLVLSHRLLGDLIGARRPTVSTALARVAAEGRLMRRHDGTWLLDGEPARPPAGTQGQAVPPRGRLLGEAPAEDRVGIWRSGEAAFVDGSAHWGQAVR